MVMTIHRSSTLALRLLTRPRASDTLKLETLEPPSSGQRNHLLFEDLTLKP